MITLKNNSLPANTAFSSRFYLLGTCRFRKMSHAARSEENRLYSQAILAQRTKLLKVYLSKTSNL